MKTILFKKAGLIYIPISGIGILLYIGTITFCITVFTAIDRHSHSVSDTLYGIFPYFVSAFTVLFWIAGNTCKKEEAGKY
jgi:hypothetical protein